jgi:hypothetical protein
MYYGIWSLAPMELENIIPCAVMCFKQRNLKHEVKFQHQFLWNFSNSFDPKMSTFIEQAPLCLTVFFSAWDELKG